MIEYEILWNGSHKDTYLCIPPVEVRDLSHVEPVIVDIRERLRYERRHDERKQILALLATKPRWSVEDLRIAVGIESAVFHGILHRLEKSRHIKHLGFGVVRLLAFTEHAS